MRTSSFLSVVAGLISVSAFAEADWVNRWLDPVRFNRDQVAKLQLHVESNALAGVYHPISVSYETPAADDRGAMLLGNGEVGVIVWLSPDGVLHTVLQRTDSWNEAGQHVKVCGIDYDTRGMVDEKFFMQELSLERGEFTAQWRSGGRPVRLRYRVQFGASPIAVCEISGAPETEARPRSWRLYPEGKRAYRLKELGINADGNAPRGSPGDRLFEISSDVIPGKLPEGHTGCCHINLAETAEALFAYYDYTQGTGDLYHDNPLRDRGFGALTRCQKGERGQLLFLSAVTCIHPCAGVEDWCRRTLEVLDRSGWSPEQEPQRLVDHVTGWRRFWDRSHIEVSPQSNFAETSGSVPIDAECRAVSFAWAAQRYITRCAGSGRLPIRFNGSLFTLSENGDPDYRRWGSGYWWQNTRLVYYPMFAAGDLELTEPLFRMYAEDLLDFNRLRTLRYLGHPGAYFPECMQPWGSHFIGTYGFRSFKDRHDRLQSAKWHRYEWVGQLELSLMLIDRYLYSGDAKWFVDRALPAIRQYVRFFDEHYRTAPGGCYDWQPAQALETWWNCTAPMPEVAGMRRVIYRLLSLPAGVLPAADRELFRRIAFKLPDLPRRRLKNGDEAYAPAAKFAEKNNIEHPELYCVFPFRLSSFEKPNAVLGVRTYNVRANRTFTGWSQEELFAAYLGLTDEARRHLVRRVLTNSGSAYRWPAFWGPNYDWCPDQSAGGNIQNTLQSMLMQVDGRKIFLLPAWPSAWNCDFRLHAPYSTVVQGRVVDGEVKDLVVIPASRRADVYVDCEPVVDNAGR